MANRISNFFRYQSDAEKTAQYWALYSELGDCNRKADELQATYSVQKSIMKGLDSLPIEKQKEAAKKGVKFIEEHTHNVKSLMEKSISLLSEMETLEKDSVLGAGLKATRKMKDAQSLYKSEKISKEAYFEIMKAVSTDKVVHFSDVFVWCGGKMLILQRADNGSSTGKVCVPGGHVDPGESHLEAAKRELFEEAGLDVPIESFSSPIIYHADGVEIHYFTVYMEGYPQPSGDFVRPSTIVDAIECAGSQWIDIYEDLDDFDFIFDMKENIQNIYKIKTDNVKAGAQILIKAMESGNLSPEVLVSMQEAVPDLFKSENKTDFSRKERRKLAKEGEALPDGSFPIRNEQDLKDAIKLVGAANDPERARRWIIKRAKALDKISTLPKDWDVEKSCGVDSALIFTHESIANVKKKKGEPIEPIEKSGNGVLITFKSEEAALLFKSVVADWVKEGRNEMIAVSEVIEKSEPAIKATMKAFFNFVEGAKTRLKNLHWTEEDAAKHENLDTLSTDLSDFEDKLSEALQGRYGRFKDGDIVGEEVSENDPLKIVPLLTEKITAFRGEVEKEKESIGSITIIDDFLALLVDIQYKLQMH